MNPCSNQLQNYFILEIHDFGFKLAIILAEDGDIYNLFKNSRVKWTLETLPVVTKTRLMCKGLVNDVQNIIPVHRN